MKKSTIALASLAGGCLAYNAVMKYFFSFTFDARRELPFSLLGADTPYENISKEGAEWIQSYPSVPISLISEDGLKLIGHYFKNPEASRTVIGFHGWRGRWYGDFAGTAKWLFENGCNLLLIEERCQQKSEGQYMGFGLAERMDVKPWIDLKKELFPDSLPIYIFGRSMGCSTVLMSSSQKLGINGIIADCGFTTPYDMIKHHAGHAFHIPEFPLVKALNHRFYKTFGYDLKSYSTLTAMKTNPYPVLFIHGKADTFVPAYMTEENYNACQSQKHLLLVEGADHCMSDLVAPEKYKQALSDFFAQYD